MKSQPRVDRMFAVGPPKGGPHVQSRSRTKRYVGSGFSRTYAFARMLAAMIIRCASDVP